MMRNLLAATAAAAMLAGSTLAFAADDTATGADKMPPAAATDSAMPAKSPVTGGTSAETLPMDKAPAAAGAFVAAQSGTDTLASKMIGQPVVNPQDETVGDIADLVMDRSGRVTVAVLGVGGFLGIGEKSVGVPIEALSPRPNEDGDMQLVTMLTREDLEQAPEFVDLETRAARDAAAALAAQQKKAQQGAQPPQPTDN